MVLWNLRGACSSQKRRLAQTKASLDLQSSALLHPRSAPPPPPHPPPTLTLATLFRGAPVRGNIAVVVRRAALNGVRAAGTRQLRRRCCRRAARRSPPASSPRPLPRRRSSPPLRRPKVCLSPRLSVESPARAGDARRSQRNGSGVNVHPSSA